MEIEINLEEVRNKAIELLVSLEPAILDYLSEDDAALALTNIYTMSYRTRGFGQDFEGRFSIISSPRRISVIFDGKSSFYQCLEKICQYQSLEDDLRTILLCTDAAIERCRNL